MPLLALAASALVATGAQARETHILRSTFPKPPPLGAIEGVAVDGSSGDVWVADRENAIIDHFNASGEQIPPQINGSETLQKTFVESSLAGLAVDPSNGDLYATEFRAGLVDKFEPGGKLVCQISEKSIPEDERGAVPFAPIGVAVDPGTSELFVGDGNNDAIDVFGSECNYIRHFTAGGSVISIAIDSLGNLYAGTPTEVEVYEAATGTLQGVLDKSESGEGIDAGVAVEPTSNDIYVEHGSGKHEVKQYKPWKGSPESPMTVFAYPDENGENGGGIGVAQAGGDVYVAGKHHVAIFGPLVAAAEPVTEPATEVTATSATLNGTVNPNGLPVKECYFEYGPTEAYGERAECEPDAGAIPTPEGEHRVQAKIRIMPDTLYHFRLVAANENAQLAGSDLTIPVPIVEADAVHTVNGEGDISVFGVVNPDGSKTEYDFEFLPEKQYEEGDWAAAITTKSQEAGEGDGPELEVEKAPSTLVPGVPYRFRVSAESTAFPGLREQSPVKRLVIPVSTPETQPICPNAAERPGLSARLPDCRAYEQVTPTEKEGAQDNFDYGKSNVEVVVGLDGEHVLMTTLSKWGQDVSGQGTTTYAFTRAPGGWTTSSLSPQPQTGGELDKPYGFYTPDLSQVLIERYSVTSVNAASPTVEFVLGPPGGPYATAGSEPQEHFTAPSREHGEEEVRHEGRWVAQSRNGAVAVIESPDHEMIAGHPTGTTAPIAVNGGQGRQGYDLYEYVGGRLRQVNIAPEGGKTIGTCGAELAQGREGGGLRGRGQGSESATTQQATGSVNAVSTNGSRIFFEAFPDGCPEAAEEKQRTQNGGGPGGPKIDLYMRVNGERTIEIGNYTFEGADPEGTRLLLSKREGGALEFFSYDTETMTAKLLFFIGEGDGLGEKHALSEDGSVFYFETTAMLTPEAPPGTKIYRYDIPTETMTFVAVSSTSGGNSGGFYVSREGSDFYFNVESVQGVSGSGGQRTHVVEVYRYDSAENVVQCVSCASPYNPEPRLLSTLMPEFGPNITRFAPLASPASANGDFVFFDTPAALLPQDIDGEISPQEFLGDANSFFSPASDVYEWRRDGVDGCGRVQGCIALITNGINGQENVLLGTDPSGEDVFFATHSQLAPTDKDGSADVVDARIGGGFPPPPPGPTECEGDACSVPPIAPFDPPQLLLPPPASLSAAPVAPAAPKPAAAKCAKGRVLRHGKCLKPKARGGSRARRSAPTRHRR